MPSIEKRGDNKYRITISNGYDREKKKITAKKTIELDPELTPAQVKKELERQAALFEEKVKKGDVVDSSTTFESFANRWLEEYAKKHLQETTVNGYRLELEGKIYQAIGHIKLSQLKPMHLIKFYENLTQDGVRLDGKSGGYSTRVIRYQHSIISSILQTAVYWQIIEENVTRRIKPPKGADKARTENYLDENQISQFLKYILETETLEFQALILVTTYGGLRKGEVLGLTWSDIDFKQNTIAINKALARSNKREFIKEPKNKASIRTIELPAVAINTLRKLKLISKSVQVFDMSHSTPTRWFSQIRDKYNSKHEERLPKNLTFHGLRHTAVTLLISQGLDIKTVSARTGHSSATTTLNIYAHAVKSRDKVAAETLANIIDIG